MRRWSWTSMTASPSIGRCCRTIAGRSACWHASLWVAARCSGPSCRSICRPRSPMSGRRARRSTMAAGNANLTQFYRDGMIERGNPLRYADIERLNNLLRERARAALVAYLTGMNRVPLPFAAGQFRRRRPSDLSALLLIDVEAGAARRRAASRRRSRPCSHSSNARGCLRSRRS